MGNILYLGDDSLSGAACYLGGVMARLGMRFDYVPSNKKLRLATLEKPYKLIIISDYPAANISFSAYKALAKKVAQGAGFLMVGGWESFHGLKGEYNRTVVEELLPVTLLKADDRDNYCYGLVPVKSGVHPITSGLPFNKPPVLCGYNRVYPKTNARVVLNLRKIIYRNGTPYLGTERIPYVVVGTYGKGRTAAATSDFAPHWVGGLVDWGTKRIQAQANGGGAIEVGELYVKFIGNLLRWLIYS